MPSWHWAAFFLNIKDLRYISQKIRDCNPGLFQIVGGQIATVMADLILEATGVDCVGLYEGEKTILALVQILQEKFRFSNRSQRMSFRS